MSGDKAGCERQEAWNRIWKMAAVNWTVETVESSGCTKCMNPQQSGCSLFSVQPLSCLSPSLRFFFFSLFFHNSTPRHTSLCGPEQHKQFSHSLCLVSHALSLLMSSSGVMHVRWLQLHCGMGAVDGGQVRREESGGGLDQGCWGETARGEVWSGGGGVGEGLMPRMQTGREEGEETLEEEVCGLIPLKALVLSAGSNYYQRARNKGSAWGWATQESA